MTTGEGTEGNVLLDVQDLCVTFASGSGLVSAVAGVSFSLRRGETLAVVGESGSGKSVTCLAILQLLARDTRARVTGTAKFGGSNLLALSERELRKVRGRRIAMVIQDTLTSLNPMMPIGGQVAEALRINTGLSHREARQRTLELLGEVGIPSPADRYRLYAHQLSGGMRQRVAIAMALACGPDLLIADEPTTALDATVEEQILHLLARLQADRGLSMIFITHDMRVVSRMADRVAVMYSGHIVEYGAAVSVLEHPRHPYTISLLGSALDGSADGSVGAAVQPRRGLTAGGCNYLSRCEFAAAQCAESYPERVTTESGYATCWKADVFA